MRSRLLIDRKAMMISGRAHFALFSASRDAIREARLRAGTHEFYLVGAETPNIPHERRRQEYDGAEIIV